MVRVWAAAFRYLNMWEVAQVCREKTLRYAGPKSRFLLRITYWMSMICWCVYMLFVWNFRKAFLNFLLQLCVQGEHMSERRRNKHMISRITWSTTHVCVTSTLHKCEYSHICVCALHVLCKHVIWEVGLGTLCLHAPVPQKHVGIYLLGLNVFVSTIISIWLFEPIILTIRCGVGKQITVA